LRYLSLAVASSTPERRAIQPVGATKRGRTHRIQIFHARIRSLTRFGLAMRKRRAIRGLPAAVSLRGRLWKDGHLAHGTLAAALHAGFGFACARHFGAGNGLPLRFIQLLRSRRFPIRFGRFFGRILCQLLFGLRRARGPFPAIPFPKPLTFSRIAFFTKPRAVSTSAHPGTRRAVSAAAKRGRHAAPKPGRRLCASNISDNSTTRGPLASPPRKAARTGFRRTRSINPGKSTGSVSESDSQRPRKPCPRPDARFDVSPA